MNLSGVKSSLDKFSMLNVTHYLWSENDFRNVIQTCKKFNDILDMFTYNPIANCKLFKTIKTQYLFHTWDTYLESIDYYHICYPVTYSQSIEMTNEMNIKHKTITFKTIKYTPEDINKYGFQPDNHVTALAEKCYSKNPMKTFNVPNGIRTFGDECFCECTNLESISIPTTLSFFGEYCFKFCLNLREINIPPTVEYFGKECFCMCTCLTSMIVPTSITFLPENCFYRCDSIKQIVLPTTLTCCYRLDNLLIPLSVVVIGDECFRNCVSLKTINLPVNVEIGKNCFEQCTRLDVKSTNAKFENTYLPL
ncbi:Leucine rich repeat protein [Entamoeba marina]